jgi:hypothetical protein
MCHEWSMRRERRREEERFDEELRHLLDEEPAHAEPPQPVVEQRDEEPSDPERARLEAAARS